MTMEPSLLDTDTLSEVMKGVNQGVQDNARQYLRAFGSFTFSLITHYELRSDGWFMNICEVGAQQSLEK